MPATRAPQETSRPNAVTEIEKMKRAAVVAAVLAICALQGCATKSYGRQDVIGADESGSMSCSEIDLELHKTEDFIDQVNKDSAFSGLDVLAILIDFGIGNYVEKSAALDSGNKRTEALHALRDLKECGPLPVRSAVPM